ncbi:toll/interleukin-1 receptor domain-containing protein [Sphingomonas sp. LM7]|uniref:toll/interleukin-1 receptor domain-containing protein n=1 Tax=Sphingomonas sp. LM7 TaxID=1938607 RepID=UPI001559353A|nr:toll/interleukin-1 receptor domain-containing protein [Sphingomonas sp. LM7]
MAEEQEVVRQYRAFLSYSHKDAAVARLVHKRLESFHMPRRLIGKRATGALPARLAPIFLDREELSAGHDLSAKVRSALAGSQSLVVLCSPDSAASIWVRKEIETFRELHPDRPVLAAIVRGDPVLCFPEALSAGGVEPLAADLRKEGDGHRLGLLKLVAGLSEVDLDALVQRDAQRRIRRVMAVTAGALAAMLVMTVLTSFALTARREAERQRAEAEGLVEFMLTDLRDRLRKVGRLDTMTAVNARALRYYGGRNDVSGLPDESLVRRARILQAVGDDLLVEGRARSALAAFDEARQTTAEQVQRGAGDQYLLAHTKSLMGIGRVYEEMRDWPRAQAQYAAAAATADRLARATPTEPEPLMKAASASINLGNVQLYGTRDYRAAQRSYDRALLMLARALRLAPGDEHILLSLANAYGYLADSFYMRGLWARSRDARLRQHAIIAPLDRPDNLDVRFRLAAARRGLALSLFRSDDKAGARARLKQAREAVDFLTSRDPQNSDWLALKRKLQSDQQGWGRRSPLLEPRSDDGRRSACEGE